MASTNKTENFGLNQWIGTDQMARADFNSDNLKLDTFMKQTQDAVQNADTSAAASAEASERARLAAGESEGIAAAKAQEAERNAAEALAHKEDAEDSAGRAFASQKAAEGSATDALQSKINAQGVEANVVEAAGTIEDNVRAYIDGLLTHYLKANEVYDAISESEIGAFNDKGKIATEADLPTAAEDFDLYHIEDYEGKGQAHVFAFNFSGQLYWYTLTGGSVNLSIYETVAGSNEKMDAAKEAALGALALHVGTIATNGAAGHIALATLNEAAAGTVASKAITPASLLHAIQNLAIGTLGALSNAAIAATDSAKGALLKLQGQVNAKLDKTDTAADSAKLNGQGASYYATATALTSLNNDLANMAARPFTIPASAWVASTAYEGYTYQATISTLGTSASAAGVIRMDFDMPSLLVAIEAEVSMGGAVGADGTSTLYAVTAPETALSGVYTITKGAQGW